MTYNPNDYQVIDEREYCDGGKAFDVKIKGAIFTIYRVMNHFKPTSIFKFNSHIGVITNDKGVVTGSIEIDWDTCSAGMLHLGEQMGLKCIPGFACSRQTYFKEVGE